MNSWVKMSKLSDDNNFEIDDKGKADNVWGFIYIGNDVASFTTKVPTEINIDSSVTETHKDTNSDNDLV